MNAVPAAGSGPPFLRVERGRPTAEELAVLAVVLHAVSAGADRPAPRPPEPARWRRLERCVAFRPGHSWQLTGPGQ